MISISSGFDMFLSGSWVDVTQDVRWTPGPIIRRGFSGSTPTDRVANTGTLTLDLNNAANNSGGKLGYYSPDHANCRAGFGIGTRIRYWLKDSASVKRYRFHGKIVEITPTFGVLRERNVSIQAVDFMEYLAETKINLLTVQTGKRPDELIAIIIGNLPIAPLATSYAISPATLAYALHADLDEKTTGMNAIQKIVQSDLGYVFVAGDSSSGETFTYQNRHSRILQTTVLATLTDTMTDLKVGRRAGDVFNDVRVTTHPVRLDTSGMVVLATAQTEFIVPAGGTVTPTLQYRDPAGNARVSGIEMIPPEGGTNNGGPDYKFTAIPGSGGSELNGVMTVTASFGANSALLTIINGGAVSAYSGGKELFQLRGRGVYLYDPVVAIHADPASGTTYGNRSISYDLPYESDINIGDAFSAEILSRYKSPISNIESVSFSANRSTTLQDYAALRDIGDRISLVETLTGINSQFFINSVEYEYAAPGILFINWLLEPIGNVGDVGIWGTNAGDSGVWGTNEADSTDWIF